MKLRVMMLLAHILAELKALCLTLIVAANIAWITVKPPRSVANALRL